MKIKDQILSSLAEIIGLPKAEIHLEASEREEHGDYATNIALAMFGNIQFPLSNFQSKNKSQKEKYEIKGPRDLAEKIVEKLRQDKELQEIVDKIEVAGAGFINFWIKKEKLLEELQTIISTGDDYGKSLDFKNKKIMIEYAHPNTHKELHIGHMRTLILGEVLSRIFNFAGAEVFRANYQGDIGPHVAKAIWGTRRLLKDRNLKWDDMEENTLSVKVHLLGEGYVLANKEYEKNKEEINLLNIKIYEKDPVAVVDYERTRRWSLEYYDSFYARFGTKFDRLYFESEVSDKGKEIVLNHVGKVFEESEGAIIFNGEKYGLHKRVFVTKDKNPTYEAKDMALAPLQYSDFPFDLNIHIVANEQKDYFRVIFKALELIDKNFKDKEYHLPMGMVNLVGRKMSSRTGDVYTVEQLLDDVKSLVVPLIQDKDLSDDEKENIAELVTIASVKYSMLKIGPSANVSFNLKQSVSVEGDSGPYLQYTFARCQSVLNRAKFPISNFQFPLKSKGLNSQISKLMTNWGLETGDWRLNSQELALLRTFVRFSEIISMSAKNYSPNILCNYLYDLASKFNLFYQKHGILEDKSVRVEEQESVRNFRLVITLAIGQILKNGLNLLGIQTPERM